jgi:hypothetical protein
VRATPVRRAARVRPRARSPGRTSRSALAPRPGGGCQGGSLSAWSGFAVVRLARSLPNSNHRRNARFTRSGDAHSGLRVAEGDLDRIRRQRELRRPYGFDDELRAALSGLPIALDAHRSDAPGPEPVTLDMEFAQAGAKARRRTRCCYRPVSSSTGEDFGASVGHRFRVGRTSRAPAWWSSVRYGAACGGSPGGGDRLVADGGTVQRQVGEVPADAALVRALVAGRPIDHRRMLVREWRRDRSWAALEAVPPAARRPDPLGLG